MEQRREAVIPERLPGVEPRPARAMRQVARAARRNTTMSVGIIIVLLMALIAAFAPLFTTVGPGDIDPINRLKAPAAQHWFGTDTLGRDVYARTIFGARVSLLVGFSVAIATMALGSLIGLLVGYYRKLDTAAMRVMDGLMAIPTILLAIALVATLGASMQNVIVSLVIVETPRMARLIRASTLSLREQAFVDAARAMGAGPGRILGNHIFPNTIAPLIVQGTFVCASAVLVEAALSFLGAGTPPEVPSWGNMMAEGRSYIEVAVWMITFPGLALTLTVLGINLAGDGLRDALDPKLRRRG